MELDLSGHIAVVTLDDPERRNALTLEMVDELIASFDAIDAANGVRAVVVAATPPAFCAGADFSLLEGVSAHPDEARDRLEAIYEGFLRVARCSLPTIAAIDGPAVGAGMNLALACDLRIAGPDARFEPRFVQLGLHPGGGHTWMLQRLVSSQTAAATVLFGQPLDAATALRTGLVWDVVSSSELARHARWLAQQAAEADRELLQRVKATLAEIRTAPSLSAAVSRELIDQVWSFRP